MQEEHPLEPPFPFLSNISIPYPTQHFLEHQVSAAWRPVGSPQSSAFEERHIYMVLPDEKVFHNQSILSLNYVESFLSEYRMFKRSTRSTKKFLFLFSGARIRDSCVRGAPAWLPRTSILLGHREMPENFFVDKNLKCSLNVKDSFDSFS